MSRRPAAYAALCATLTLLAGCAAVTTGIRAEPERARWDREASRVTITRDDWGIAHVHGATDADAVFGMIYAQAEDDFNRIETNYLVSLGRLAEAEGESAVWQDLRQRLFIDPDTLRALYAKSPADLRVLMDAWADGLNFFLATHPDVHPRAIRRFEPWMALSFSEGSIGGDIESVSLRALAAFYGPRATGARGEAGGARELALTPPPDDRGFFHTVAAGGTGEAEAGGSNGIAIAPANTRDGHALLLINPHTTFFFRSELQVTSDAGLNAYGAVTWGQFFIYQGFNERLGWMHTSSGVDVIDEFLETVTEQGGRRTYRYGSEDRPVASDTVTLAVRGADGRLASRTFTVFHTHHGPIVRQQGAQWVSVALMNRPVEALTQSYMRTRARDFASYQRISDLRANSSNNTIYADADGHIAYLHPQFIPRRDDRFDYGEPVDGSDPATDWKGLHDPAEAPHLLDPPNGWLYNSNNWPYSAAGDYSPKRDSFPRYMDRAGENERGLHALRLLTGRHDFTLEGLRAAAYDSWQPAFARLVPMLVAAWDSLPAGAPERTRLAEEISALRDWDFRWSAASVPTSLAVFWGEDLWRRLGGGGRPVSVLHFDRMAASSGADKLAALADASDRLRRDFGTWRTPWGEINRFQRLTGDIVQQFTDSGPSTPVEFTSASWGSLASFAARAYPGTKRYYGTSGNSFVAVVQFGDSVRAIAVTAGGESGNPASPHFKDQAQRYATGNLRPVYFYPNQLVGHTERVYRPGEPR